jgi:hypothetical protein
MYDDICNFFVLKLYSVSNCLHYHKDALQMAYAVFGTDVYIASITASRYHKFVRDIAITRKMPVLPLPAQSSK